MGTRGDLYVKSKGDTAIEINRYFIDGDAYIDDAGLKGIISRASALVKESKAGSIINGMIVDRPNGFYLENMNRDGGYTYILDQIEETITFGYKYSGDDSWCIKMSIAEFIGTDLKEVDYIKMPGRLDWKIELDKLNFFMNNPVSDSILIEEMKKRGLKVD